MLFLNGLHAPFMDPVMWWASERLIWIPLYIFILFLFIRKFKGEAFWPIVFTILAVALSDYISSHFIKEIFRRLRPSYDSQIGPSMHTLNGYMGGLYGFVSSHASNSFALATICFLFLRDRLFTIGIFAWAILVSYSRIYLGVHYPADVLCGAIFGSGLAGIIYYCWLKVSIFPHENSYK